MAEMILPGTYITVRDEGLISAGRVATGNIGVVGTAAAGPVNEVKILGSFTEASQLFGASDPWQGGQKNELTLVRALEQIYNNGGRTVYAVRVASAAAARASYQLTDAENKNWVRLEARTQGTQGNQIQLKVGSAGEAAPDKKTIELSYGTIKETYTIGSAAEFAGQVNERSALVSATVAKGASALPKDIGTDGERLGGGNNGENASVDDYEAGLAKLETEIVNIVLLAGQDSANSEMATALQAHLNSTREIKRERIGIIGSNGTDDLDNIAGHTFNSDRLIFVAPGIRVSPQVTLPGSYMAAAVAGLISSLPVQASPTNKTLNIPGLSAEFTASQLEKLVQSRVLVVEKREGFRITKGITTATNSAWHQITTRRIVDQAIYGVRSACNPYIGKLNNDRVRGAMKATLDAFLTRMVDDEALVGYTLDVSATRAQQIAGEAIVTMTIQPTFSIDFIKVTMYLG